MQFDYFKVIRVIEKIALLIGAIFFGTMIVMLMIEAAARNMP